MASSDLATDVGSPSLKTQRTNYYCLFRLISELGTEALRKLFDNIHSPKHLQSCLQKNEAKLRRLWPKVINNEQWNLLYPADAGQVMSANFDISLLVILLRNICRLTQPTSGWDKKPPDGDHSIQADIARLKYYRNKIAHNTSASIDDKYFDIAWEEVGGALERLSIGREDIERIRNESIDAELQQKYKGEIEKLVLSGQETARKIDSMHDKLDELLEWKGRPAQDLKSSQTDGSHSVVSSYVDDITSDPFVTFTVCAKHEGWTIDKVCKTCKEPICSKCISIVHPSPDHDVAELHDYLPELRGNVKQRLQHMKKKEEKVGENVETGNDYISILTGHYEEQRECINRAADEEIKKITQKIETMRSDLLNQLSIYYTFLKGVLTDEIKKLEKLQKNLKSTSDIIDEFLQKGDVTNLILALKEVSGSESTIMQENCIFQNRCDKVAVFRKFPGAEAKLEVKVILGELSLPAQPHASHIDGILPDTVKQGTIVNIKVCTRSAHLTDIKQPNKNVEPDGKGDYTDCKDLEINLTGSSGETTYNFSNRYGTGRYSHSIPFFNQGKYTLSITLRKHHIRGSPHTLDVTPWDERDIGVNLRLGPPNTVRALAADENDNIIIATAQTVYVVSQDDEIINKFQTPIQSSQEITDIDVTALGTFLITTEKPTKVEPRYIKSYLYEYSRVGKRLRDSAYITRIGSVVALSKNFAIVAEKKSSRNAILSLEPKEFGKEIRQFLRTKAFPKAAALSIRSDRKLVASSSKEKKVVFFNDERGHFLFNDCKCPLGVATGNFKTIFVCDSDDNDIKVFDGDFQCHRISLSYFNWEKPDKIAVLKGDPCKLVFTVDDNQAIKMLTYL